ncbi:MAG: hypothetical protein KYX69_15120 [Sphingomonas sp.]|uniref:hypothetical protein n=1 Tax=Sphingomonas sp. TaxID=28214 RepID=UPI002619CF9A|nr:hypothetical protein [Sphingomonas sp.]MDK2769040.1 hypothetical protein [Sphingomonas sp.]
MSVNQANVEQEGCVLFPPAHDHLLGATGIALISVGSAVKVSLARDAVDGMAAR